MQTNPESAAVEAVAWLRDIDGTGSLHPCAKGDPGAIEFYPQSALDALRGEVERLRRELTLANGWIDDPQLSARTAVDNANALTDIQRERADAAERRVAELEAMTGKHDLGNGERIECHITVGVNVWRGERWVSFHQCSPEEFALTLASIKEKNAALTKESP